MEENKVLFDDHVETVKKRLPIISFGVGSGLGILLADKMKSRNAMKHITVPALSGIALYAGSKMALTGKPLNNEDTLAVSALGGGLIGSSAYTTKAEARRVPKNGFYNKILRRTTSGKINPLKRNIAGAIGSIALSAGAVMFNNHRDKSKDGNRR